MWRLSAGRVLGWLASAMAAITVACGVPTRGLGQAAPRASRAAAGHTDEVMGGGDGRTAENQQPSAAPTSTTPDSHRETAAAATRSDAASRSAAERGTPRRARPRAADADRLSKTIAGAYKPLFFDNDFSYLNNPAYDRWFAGDRLKQLNLLDGWTLDAGGQYRARFHAEQNFRGLGLTGLDDRFLLHRTRLFGHLRGELVHVYAEMIDAESNYEDFPPRAIEVNRADLLNLFADVVLWDADRGRATLRVGRQELLYGSQRLISPLDWANTRRTFEGAKLFWTGENWNLDAFLTQPVLTRPTRFDRPADQQVFFGSYATYKGWQNQTIDLYALQFNDTLAPADFRFTTLGGRWLGKHGDWQLEVEGGVQFGRNSNGTDHAAGFCTGGVGYTWSDVPWKPTLWTYYDWAEGDRTRGAANGFHHLFPLAHRYLGFMDLFARSNIESPNLLLTAQPSERLNLLVWYYYFFLENRNDVPYNLNMAPFVPGSAPASADLGHELDFLATVALNPRMEVVFGYSHFFAGRYYRHTPGLPHRTDADFYYVQYQWNF